MRSIDRLFWFTFGIFFFCQFQITDRVHNFVQLLSVAVLTAILIFDTHKK